MTVGPDHEFGRPRFAHGGSAVDNVIDLSARESPSMRSPRNSSRDESRTRSVAQREQPPRFFLDRSLGRKSSPQGPWLTTAWTWSA